MRPEDAKQAGDNICREYDLRKLSGGARGKYHKHYCAAEPLPRAGNDLPPLPKPDKNGNFPAVEYARISLARDIVRDRRAAGLTQQQLAKMVGTRQETISRIETGKHTASVKLVDKIDRALRKALDKRAKNS
jgi:DNA-binding XRE family transcriptional regulator